MGDTASDTIDTRNENTLYHGGKTNQTWNNTYKVTVGAIGVVGGKEKKEEMSDKFTSKIFWTMTLALICCFAIWSGIQTLEN